MSAISLAELVGMFFSTEPSEPQEPCYIHCRTAETVYKDEALSYALKHSGFRMAEDFNLDNPEHVEMMNAIVEFYFSGDWYEVNK